jgi:hypothetical protein
MKDIEKELRKIKKALECQTTALLETRPLCITPTGEGENPCFNIYGIYKVTENSTTLVRYESQFGEVFTEEVLQDVVFTTCTCDCEGTGTPSFNEELPLV